jgi:hypothetical protein
MAISNIKGSIKSTMLIILIDQLETLKTNQS